jgi:hypothetical protein
MKHCRVLFLLLLALLPALAACGPGHVGSDVIAFVRDGHLWTIYSDGSNAYEVVSDGPPVIGYDWSPNHQILAYRVLDDTYAKTSAARQLFRQPLTGLVGDLPSALYTVSVDGGSTIPILFSNSSLRYSNAWWNPQGNRLLIRLTLSSGNFTRWQVAQNDQPGGIALKALPASFSIPSLASTSLMAAGNSEDGLYTSALDGTNQRILVSGLLPGHPLPAALERILLQPAHANPALLYALPAPALQGGLARPSAFAGVQLVMRDPAGRTTPLVNCHCTQFSWSPDGRHILYTTGATYTLLNLNGRITFSLQAESGSVPYWSSDSRFLLLDGPHTLTLVRLAGGQSRTLLSDGKPSVTSSPPLAAAGTLLQPVTGNSWSVDSQHFLFLTRGRLQWQGQRLADGNGIYKVTLDDQGQVQGSPAVVDTGNDSQPHWSFQDANTSFLF